MANELSLLLSILNYDLPVAATLELEVGIIAATQTRCCETSMRWQRQHYGESRQQCEDED